MKFRVKFAEDLIGKEVRAVRTEDDGRFLVFEFESGDRAKFKAAGDCCSVSWIESIDAPPDVAGARLTGVSGAGDSYYRTKDDPEHDCLQYYKTVFHTNRGDITVEYRNSSNGYYGGSLERVDA